MNAQEAFSELRALLQRPPSRKLREDVYASINAFFGEASESEQARFHAEYLAPVLDMIEVWPIELRYCSLAEPGPGEIWLARIIYIRELTPNQITKKLGAIPDMARERFDGVWLWDEYQNANEKLRTALKNLGPIRHLVLEVNHGVGKVLDALTEDQADVLEHIRAKAASEDPAAAYANNIDGYLGAIVERLEKFPALCSLSVNHTIAHYTHQPRAWFKELSEHPRARNLTSLSLHAKEDLFKDEWLTDSETWAGLKRLRVLGLPRERAMQLIASPNLANVEIWNLEQSFWGEDPTWLDPQTTYWTSIAGGEHPSRVLHRERVDLAMSEEELEHIFFDEYGSLCKSTNLRELYADWLYPNIMSALLEQGAEAFPNLRKLMFRGMDFISPELYRQIDASALWERLDVFDWSTYKIDPRYHRHLSNDERAECYQQWWELVQDEALDLELRKRAWQTVLKCTDELKHYKLLARIVGLKGRSKLDKSELKKRLEALLPS
jgi:hypothetical protein